MSTTQIATWSSFTVFTCQTRRWKVCDAIDIRAPHGPGSPRASRPSGSLGGWSDIFRHRVHAPHRAHGWSGEHYYPFGCRRSHILPYRSVNTATVPYDSCLGGRTNSTPLAL